MASKNAKKNAKKKPSKKKPASKKPVKKKQPLKKKQAKKKASKKGPEISAALAISGVIVVGSAVEFKGAVGRVCRIKANGICCVQFAQGCVQVAKSSLVPTSKPAPGCTPACANC